MVLKSLYGQRYSHILNPKTSWPVQGLAAVSVIAVQCLVAGSLCTITMLKGKEGIAWLADVELPHIWMDLEKRTGEMLKIADRGVRQFVAP